MSNILIFSMIFALLLPRGLRLGAGVVVFLVIAGVNSVVVGVN